MNQSAPFLKWAGGKRQLLGELVARVPEDFGTYHEFFLGGGALFFELYNQGRIKRAVLSDINERLMNAYRVVKERPQELIDELRTGDYQNEKERFYAIRTKEPEDSVERAARFIYLNKTAFNGLYRENRRGEFNVPFGAYKNPRILDEEKILLDSEALSCATLLCGDFSKILDYAVKGDFAYFDPPYVPLDKTASFTAYHSSNFGLFDQHRLKSVFEQLASRGVHVLLSNSYTDAAKELFAEHTTAIVSANRMINCIAEKRGKVRELLVTNAKSISP